MSKENRKIEIITILIAAILLAVVSACVWYVLPVIFLRLYNGADFLLSSGAEVTSVPFLTS
jgi:hypothetical protein